MSRLQLIRGIPGSGKSTVAKRFDGILVLEPDMLCVTDGVYDWSLNKEIRNRSAIITMANSMMRNHVDLVIASVLPHDGPGSLLRCLLTSASRFDTEVFIFDCTDSHQNVHDVPEDVMSDLRRQFVPAKMIIPRWWTNIRLGLMDSIIKVNAGKPGVKGAQ